MRLNLNKPMVPPDEQILERELNKLKQADAAPVRVSQPQPKQRFQKPEIGEERRAMHNQNRMLKTIDALALLKKELPEAFALAEVVGQWIWIEFKSKPERSTLNRLYDLGCAWSHGRGAWYHPCGVFVGRSKGDPRAKYQTIAANEMLPEGAADPVAA